jgi:hypothetical protein
MRHWVWSLALIVVVTLALTFPAGAPAAPAAHNATVAAASPAPHANATPEPHPEIRAALDSLHHAKEHLEHAAHDFGGHRVDAIHAIDEAQKQLEVCLQYDR